MALESEPGQIVKLFMLRYLFIIPTVFLLCSSRNLAAQTSETQTKLSPAVASAMFNGERAMADLVKQVDGGPRLPDSPGLLATQDLITKTLKDNNWSVETQDVTAESPLLKRNVSGKNIFGVYPKGSTVKYLISAHYDTRPYADMDPDNNQRQMPVPGGNDGASGVAVLLELARVIPLAKPSQGIALVFFDLEDHGTAGDETGFCKGSQHFASNIPAQVKDFQYGINIDMIGDSDLFIPMEGNSLDKAPKLAFDLWRTGNKMFPEIWSLERGPNIYDDHMPFLNAGKQYVDVIDIKYPFWHTVNDTPDKCSSQSLDAVGDTLLTFIFR